MGSDILSEDQVIKMLGNILKENGLISRELIYMSCLELHSAIYYKAEPMTIPKGAYRLYYYLDLVFKELIDYSMYVKKCSYKYYFTEERIIRILIAYLEKYGDFHNIYSSKPKFMLAISRKGSLDGYINILVEKYGYKKDNLDKYRNNYWSQDKTLEKANEIYIKTKNFNLLLWKGAGYPETPMIKYGVQKTKETLGIKKKLYSRDGHHFRSFREVVVANILWQSGLKYDKDYRVFTDYYYSCDFYIYKKLNNQLERDIILEVWGYPESAVVYTARKYKKIKMYRKINADFIQVPFKLFNSYNTSNSIISYIFEELSQFDKNIKLENLSHEAVFFKSKNDYKKRLDLITERIKPYIHQDEYMPSEAELKGVNDYGLIIMIKNLGGFIEASKILGYKPKSQYIKPPKSKIFIPENHVKNLIEIIEKFNYSFFPRLETLKKLDKTLGSRLRIVSNYLQVIELAKEKSGLNSYLEVEMADKEILQSDEKEELLKNLIRLSDHGKVKLKKRIVIECLGNRGYNKIREYFGGIERSLQYIPKTEVVDESYM